MQSATETGLRVLLVFCVALLMAATIWICLVVGFVVVLRPALGLGGALLCVGGGLATLALLLLLLKAPRRAPPDTPQSDARQEAFALALRALQTPRGGRLAMGAIGIALLGLALMLPGRRDDPPG